MNLKNQFECYITLPLFIQSYFSKDGSSKGCQSECIDLLLGYIEICQNFGGINIIIKGFK